MKVIKDINDLISLSNDNFRIENVVISGITINLDNFNIDSMFFSNVIFNNCYFDASITTVVMFSCSGEIRFINCNFSEKVEFSVYKDRSSRENIDLLFSNVKNLSNIYLLLSHDSLTIINSEMQMVVLKRIYDSDVAIFNSSINKLHLGYDKHGERTSVIRSNEINISSSIISEAVVSEDAELIADKSGTTLKSLMSSNIKRLVLNCEIWDSDLTGVDLGNTSLFNSFRLSNCNIRDLDIRGCSIDSEGFVISLDCKGVEDLKIPNNYRIIRVGYAYEVSLKD